MEQKVDFHGMFRVVDVEKALRLMRHPQGKGSYTIGLDSWVSLSGHFTSAPSTIQCMYAPEFTAATGSQPLNTGK